MAGPVLERSAETFRRNGSSGLVWEDRFLSEDLSLAMTKKEGAEFRELRQYHSVGTIGQMDRSRTNDGRRPYPSTMVSPAIDPPSPKLPVCSFFGFLGNSGTGKRSKPGRYVVVATCPGGLSGR